MKESKLKNITIQNWNWLLHPLDIHLYIHFAYDRKHSIQKLLHCQNFSTSTHIGKLRRTIVATFKWELKNIHTTPRILWMKVTFFLIHFIKSQFFLNHFFQDKHYFFILINYLSKQSQNYLASTVMYFLTRGSFDHFSMKTPLGLQELMGWWWFSKDTVYSKPYLWGSYLYVFLKSYVQNFLPSIFYH